jgi:hypothetical protein
MGIISLIILGGIIWLVYTKGVGGCLRYVILGVFGLLFLLFFIGLFIDTPSNYNDSSSYTDTEDKYSRFIYIENENLANPNDIYEAKKFLRNLPEACKETKAWVKSDGTVHVKLYCNGNGHYTNGYVEIKNGKITEVK